MGELAHVRCVCGDFEILSTRKPEASLQGRSHRARWIDFAVDIRHLGYGVR